jgi:hypothetical protein
VLDGKLADWRPALELKEPKPSPDASARVSAKAAVFKESLYLAVQVTDDVVTVHDQLEVTLFFPGAGTTARGAIYSYGKDGLRTPHPEVGPPAFAQPLLKSGVLSSSGTTVFELAFPARSLPRFPAAKPLVLSVCLEYLDVDEPEGTTTPTRVFSCPTGEMVQGPVRLPDEFRRSLKLAVSPEVEGLEARPDGWVGFSRLHSPTWVQSDASLTPESLARLVAFGQAVDPASVSLAVPRTLMLGDNRPVFTVVTGQNPYDKERCNAAVELRLTMYVVRGQVANRVLEWPAATCNLGRAMRFELDPESGQLLIGYTNGQSARFIFTDDHFERSELGALVLHRFWSAT